jgi:hypothetical protein
MEHNLTISPLIAMWEKVFWSPHPSHSESVSVSSLIDLSAYFSIGSRSIVSFEIQVAVLWHYFCSKGTLALTISSLIAMSQAHIQGHLVTATFDDSFPNSRISQQLAAMLNIFDSRITLPINANMGSGPLTSVVEFEVDDGLCSTNKHHVKKVTRANKNLPRNALHPQHHPPIRLSPAVIFVVSKLKTSSFRTLQERRASTWRRRYAHARPAPQQ